MNIKEFMQVNFSITKNGLPLSKDKYKIDIVNQVISTNENGVVFDCSELNGWVFKTGYGCTFKTGSDCTFKTGSCCTFKTDYGCTFNTGSFCTFKTDSDCTFDTGDGCTFKTGSRCTFDTGYGCTFLCGRECVCVRRDVYEVIEIPDKVKIKLNEYDVKGYKRVK